MMQSVVAMAVKTQREIEEDLGMVLPQPHTAPGAPPIEVTRRDKCRRKPD